MPPEFGLPIFRILGKLTNRGSSAKRDEASSPIRLFLATIACIFVVELLSSWVFANGNLKVPGDSALADAAVLIAIVVPIAYILLLRPLTGQIRQRAQAEGALRLARDELEERVLERTAELKESNRRLQGEMEEHRLAGERIRFQARLLDAVEHAVAAIDRDGRVRYWNRFGETLYGWKASEVVDRPLSEIWPSEHDGEGIAAALDGCSAPQGWTGELLLPRRDGDPLPVYVSCAIIPGPDGHEEGSVVTSIDISERKAAEEALRYSEDKYSTLVESSPTGIFVIQDGKITFVNEKLARMLEYPREALIGTAASALVYPDDLDFASEIARKRAAGEPYPEEYECRLVTRSGEVRWASLRTTLLSFRGSAVSLGNVLDVTERKQMERALREKTTALHELSARLLTAQEEERRRLSRELHDSLGQTLSAAKFSLEAALGGPCPEERRGQTNGLQSMVSRIQDAIDEMRRISMALRPSILDDLGLLPTMNWYLREFQENYPNLAVERNLSVVESVIPEDLKTPIFRILQEATNNVAKHSGATHLRVGLRADGNTLRLSIQDDGVGFDPVAKKKEASGTGLGSLRERTELSGGLYSLVSAPGAGTSVEAAWSLDREATSG